MDTTRLSKHSRPSWLTFRTVFWFAAAVMCAVMVLASLGCGIIWDEWIQSHYGKLVLRFLVTGGADRACLNFATMYLYGGLFDTLAAFLYGVFFDRVSQVAYYGIYDDVKLYPLYETRHVLNAVFGFAAVLGTGLLTAAVGGWRAGLLALGGIFLSPRFFGNSLNNPKDIPFAAAYVFALFFLVRFLKSLSRPGWLTAAGLAASIAVAIGIKAGGLMLLHYLIFFTGAFWAYHKWISREAVPAGRLAAFVTGIALAGYLGGLVFWPYGLVNPLYHPWKALAELSRFTSAEGSLLFQGRVYAHGGTPWNYIPLWIFISSPFFFLIGLALFAGFPADILKRRDWKLVLILIFAGLFPWAYATLHRSVVYDSWRHFLFIYPPLLALAALGWDSLISRARSRKSVVLLSLLIAGLLAEPAAWMIRNHPHEYVYFNPSVGGLKGAFGRYETDYWGNSLRLASEWLARHHQETRPGQPAVVRADGELMSSAYYLVRKLGPLYVPFVEGRNQWDYWLRLSRGLPPQDLRGGAWPPAGTLHEVRADGVVLCAVVKKNPGSPPA
ncbi:MAG: hypothetical protein HY714_04740 [Candidatus Omnitrophica bacterium]|nr:hypothetical protein [Candidatus Omnitrophota bacterium]